MSTISAAMVKELRERTGAGMMECKKALTETNGDLEAAVEHMRKTGLAKADKKAGRTAAEGIIVMRASADNKRAVMVEINCETDFVAKGDAFQAFAKEVGEVALDKMPADIDALLALTLPSTGETITDSTRALIAKIGENINVRRYEGMSSANGIVAGYLHGTRIGVLVEQEGGSQELARDIAMHVAASRPECVSEEQVDPALIQKEREIFAAQSAESGKPADIIAKMVDGRIKKFLKEVTLLGQPFVKDPDTTVEKLLKDKGAKVLRFSRLAVGEGIEKKVENFAEEVAAQARGK